MPILDLQRRLAEVGRIRMGEKIGNRPARRETWRLTSRNLDRLQAAQIIYPGELRPWDNNGSAEHELLTTVDALRVMVLPGQTLSQWYEMWSGGGCQRRCDGERTILPDDGPCLCPADHRERTELAKRGKACKATTRLSVLLPDVAGIGCWRLETHGYYAAVELAGIAELLERATSTGVMLPAILRIDQRSDVKDGQTRRYPVPVIEIEATPDEVRELGSGSESQRALPAPSPAGPRSAPELGSGGTDGAERGGVARASTGEAPESDAPGGDPVPLVSDGQRRHLFRVARERGVGEDGLREVLLRVTGQGSTAAIPASAYEAIKKELAG